MLTTAPLSRWQWLYALALAATVVWASGHGQVATPNIVNFDKFAHFSVFGLLATLVLRPFRTRAFTWAVLIVAIFGASDEIHQSFTPGRSMDYHDWMADTAGAIVAVAVYTFWPWYRRLLETRLLNRKKNLQSTPVSAATTPVS